MLNSINLQPYLVVLDGHCFPMAKTPGGTLLGVEVTGVGDGYSKSADFVKVVKSAGRSGRISTDRGGSCWLTWLRPVQRYP